MPNFIVIPAFLQCIFASVPLSAFGHIIMPGSLLILNQAVLVMLQMIRSSNLSRNKSAILNRVGMRHGEQLKTKPMFWFLRA